MTLRRRQILGLALTLACVQIALCSQAWSQVNGAPRTPGPPGMSTTPPPNAPGPARVSGMDKDPVPLQRGPDHWSR